jgi:quinol-cytochrome oxidoreductase complex cytochrome b subunit
MRRIPLHRWLAALPALLILIGAPFANRVHGLVMGLPFLLFWIVGCVLLTTVVMAIVGALDKAYEARAKAAPPANATGGESSR